MMFGRRQSPGLGQLQDLQALLTAVCHLLKPAQGERERERENETKQIQHANVYADAG